MPRYADSQYMFPLVLFQVPIMTLAGHHEGVMGVCWRDTSDLVTASLDHTIRVWNLETQTNTQTIVSSS